jgi:hypothetical protein
MSVALLLCRRPMSPENLPNEPVEDRGCAALPVRTRNVTGALICDTNYMSDLNPLSSQKSNLSNDLEINAHLDSLRGVPSSFYLPCFVYLPN